jgi:hypothetical protein
MIKYSRTISCDNVQLIFNVWEIFSISIVRVDEEISETSVCDYTPKRLMTRVDFNVFSCSENFKTYITRQTKQKNFMSRTVATIHRIQTDLNIFVDKY